MALMDGPDLAATLRSVARVLEPGGWFVFSIVHPCYHRHVEIVSDYRLDHRYLETQPVNRLPPYAYHRPLGVYLGGLAQAGFRLEPMVGEHRAGRPQDAGGVPGLLHARARRCEGRAPKS